MEADVEAEARRFLQRIRHHMNGEEQARHRQMQISVGTPLRRVQNGQTEVPDFPHVTQHQGIRHLLFLLDRVSVGNRLQSFGPLGIQNRSPAGEHPVGCGLTTSMI
ncbi:hypothetical protein D9M71_799540 [compost metagenome]